MRETLFNWLQATISGADCLDLFAGTGVLGFEALSRGANSATMVEINAHLIQSMRNQANQFSAENCDIHHADSLAWLSTRKAAYDIVFLDPPFGEGLLDKAISIIQSKNLLKPGALVYVEAESGLTIKNEILKEYKHSNAGQVQYGLLKFGIEDEW